LGSRRSRDARRGHRLRHLLVHGAPLDRPGASRRQAPQRAWRARAQADLPEALGNAEQRRQGDGAAGQGGRRGRDPHHRRPRAARQAERQEA
jgi:hypothetical protein